MMDFMNMFRKEQDHALDRILGAAAGITAGLGLMYILDPTMGRRRREMFVDGMACGANKVGEGMSAAWHKTSDAVSEAAEKVADGAKSVADKATSMFSGGSHERGHTSESMDEPWSPTTRMLVGTAGGALVAYGMTQRFPVACAIGTVGLGLVARAVTNFEIEQYLGMGGHHEESKEPPQEAIRPEQSRIPPPHTGRPPAMSTMGGSSRSAHAEVGDGSHRVNTR